MNEDNPELRKFENLRIEDQSPEYIFIDNETSALKEAIESLNNARVISIDCEGVHLSRKGKLTLVQIRKDEGQIFIFDIFKLKSIEFLKSIIESDKILKLAFDFRNDYDALFHQFGISPRNVLDLQLIEFWFRENLSLEKNIPLWAFKNIAKGKLGWTCLYLPSLKDKVSKIKMTNETWLNRPLTKELLQYSANDVQKIFNKYECYLDNITISKMMSKFLQFSDNYIKSKSCIIQRTFDDFDDNSIMPIQVFILNRIKLQLCSNCKIMIPIEVITKTSGNCYQCWLKLILNKRNHDISYNNNFDYDSYSGGGGYSSSDDFYS